MDIEGLQKRIKTTQDLRSIVSTMKSLSAVSIIQYDTALKSLIEYGRTINLGAVALMKNGDLELPKEPRVKPESRRVLAVLIGSDTGLVGKMNREVVRFAQKSLTEKGFQINQTGFIAVGRQIIGQLMRNQWNIVESYPISNSVKAVSKTAASVLVTAEEYMRTNHITHVYVYYSEKRGVSVSPTSTLLMPLGTEWLERLKKMGWPGRNFPTYTLPPQTIYSALLKERLLIELSTAITEALSAEHHMRLTTMQAAEKNIDENLEAMNLEYQQMRQENITTELLDVVSGAEALRTQKKK
ncbi:MAG: F0F1 ATP synthase subunit gamma [Alphaproteobacteria bacterium]|nr:F0F1 ATP synthase subunit gamma [Alphaproteobacteria bacterium]